MVSSLIFPATHPTSFKKSFELFAKAVKKL